MTNLEKFNLSSEVDIVNARMAVRDFARGCGFGLADQACISMAASSLAYALGFARQNTQGGEMLMEQFTNQQHRKGMRVHCIKNKTDNTDRDVVQNLGNARLLVDDIEVKPFEADGVEVIIVKWDSVNR